MFVYVLVQLYLIVLGHSKVETVEAVEAVETVETVAEGVQGLQALATLALKKKLLLFNSIHLYFIYLFAVELC